MTIAISRIIVFLLIYIFSFKQGNTVIRQLEKTLALAWECGKKVKFPVSAGLLYILYQLSTSATAVFIQSRASCMAYQLYSSAIFIWSRARWLTSSPATQSSSSPELAGLLTNQECNLHLVQSQMAYQITSSAIFAQSRTSWYTSFPAVQSSSSPELAELLDLQQYRVII